jgi:hypothetical protein
MTIWIIEQFHGNNPKDNGQNMSNSGIAVSDLLSKWKGGSKQPAKDDLHIQIHRMVKEGLLQLTEDSKNDDYGALVGLDAVVLLKSS